MLLVLPWLPGLLRFTEAVVFACSHTYNLETYTQILVRYGIIEAGERPIGLNRTSRLRDGAAGTINNDAMAWILDHTDQEKETQNSIEYNDMHGRIKAWLKGKGGMRRRREHNGSFGHISGRNLPGQGDPIQNVREHAENQGSRRPEEISTAWALLLVRIGRRVYHGTCVLYYLQKISA